MKSIYYGIIIAIILFALYTFIMSKSRKDIINKSIDLIKDKKRKELEALLNKKTTFFFLKPFEIYRLRLIDAVASQNEKDIAEKYKAFDQLRMNKKEKENIYSDAFFYFVSIKKNDEAIHYYQQLENLKDYHNKFLVNVSYNTFIEKGFTYLDETLEKYDKASKVSQITLASLISQMYENKGDKKNAKKYEEIATKELNK